MRNTATPVLAEAAGALSDQLRSSLVQLSTLVRPHAAALETRFLARLEALGYSERQRRSLAGLTLGNAARGVSQGRVLSHFFEQVEYNGRRLAKLNLPPTAAAEALTEYDKLLTPMLRELALDEGERWSRVREQLQVYILLTLNNAYYEVREAETHAFYEMFWAELKSGNVNDFLGRVTSVLARFCRADQARLYLVEPGGHFVCRAHSGGGEPPQFASRRAEIRRRLASPSCIVISSRTKNLVLDPNWLEGFGTCWSIPLISGRRLAGVLQIAFGKTYEWLPREQELLTAAADRCSLALEKVQLLENLSTQQVQIRRLAESMLTVEEVERRRISRELHDQTGQDLLWIRLQMEMLEKNLPVEEAGWRSKLGEIRDMTERTIVEIRRLIAALSPAVLDQLGLAAALRQLVKRFHNSNSAKVKLHIGLLPPLPKQMEVIVYRLVQECLSNISKHAGCDHVSVSLNCGETKLKLTVQDDGVGFDLDEALNKPGSFGLAGVRERVALMGGKCDIESRRRTEHRNAVSGTRVHVELPVPSSTASSTKVRGARPPTETDGPVGSSRENSGTRSSQQSSLPVETKVSRLLRQAPKKTASASDKVFRR